MEIINRRVSFRIRDVSIPAPQQILMELHGDDIVEGKAIDISDGGTEAQGYVVVEVKGVAQPLVIAVDRIIAVA